jgi:hypothetical protein
VRSLLECKENGVWVYYLTFSEITLRALWLGGKQAGQSVTGIVNISVVSSLPVQAGSSVCL